MYPEVGPYENDSDIDLEAEMDEATPSVLDDL